MKQTMQQTAVQRAIQPAARSIPSGLEQFDMAAGEETSALEDEGYTRVKQMQAKSDEIRANKARLASVAEEDLATPGREDDMIALGAAAAAASGYGTGGASSSSSAAAADTDVGSSTAIIPVSARTQALEEVIQGSLRGGVVPSSAIRWGSNKPKMGWGFYHRRDDSGASTESATSAVSATSTATTVAIPTATTVAIPPRMSEATDIQVLIGVARERRVAWNLSNDIEKIRISMRISDLIVQIENLIKLKGKFRTDPETGHRVKTPIWKVAYDKMQEATVELIKIMQMPE